MLRLDLHVHTRHSKDSTTPIPAVVRHRQTGFARLRKALR